MLPQHDKRLMGRILAGERDACAELVGDHHQAVYRLLLRLCQDSTMAEDLTQETFLAAWTGASSFDGRASLATWLHRIAYRKFIDRQRGLQITAVRLVGDEENADLSSTPLDKMIGDEQFRCLERAVGRLPLADREAIVLHYFQALSFRQMSVVLDQPIGTVKWRTSQALSRLRVTLEKGE